MITKTTQLNQFVLCRFFFFLIYLLFYLLLLGINFWYIIAKTITLNLRIQRKFEYLILKGRLSGLMTKQFLNVLVLFCS